jgi:hypothetical protein
LNLLIFFIAIAVELYILSHDKFSLSCYYSLASGSVLLISSKSALSTSFLYVCQTLNSINLLPRVLKYVTPFNYLCRAGRTDPSFNQKPLDGQFARQQVCGWINSKQLRKLPRQPQAAPEPNATKFDCQTVRRAFYEIIMSDPMT